MRSRYARESFLPSFFFFFFFFFFPFSRHLTHLPYLPYLITLYHQLRRHEIVEDVSMVHANGTKPMEVEQALERLVQQLEVGMLDGRPEDVGGEGDGEGEGGGEAGAASVSSDWRFPTPENLECDKLRMPASG